MLQDSIDFLYFIFISEVEEDEYNGVPSAGELVTKRVSHQEKLVAMES